MKGHAFEPAAEVAQVWVAEGQKRLDQTRRALGQPRCSRESTLEHAEWGWYSDSFSSSSRSGGEALARCATHRT